MTTTAPEQLYDSHCRKPACTCHHTSCYRGWRDTTDAHTTAPCLDCRPATYERWLKAQEARAKGYPAEAVARMMTGK